MGITLSDVGKINLLRLKLKMEHFNLLLGAVQDYSKFIQKFNEYRPNISLWHSKALHKIFKNYIRYR